MKRGVVEGHVGMDDLSCALVGFMPRQVAQSRRLSQLALLQASKAGASDLSEQSAPKRAFRPVKSKLEVGDSVRCRDNDMQTWVFGTVCELKPLKVKPDSGIMANIPTEFKLVEPHPIPKVADQVKAMPEKEFKGVYEPGDVGIIVEIGEKILVTWERSGQTSAMTKEAWYYWFTIIGEVKPVPENGDRVRVLPGVEFEGFYKEGDVGSVVGQDATLIWITWESTGKMSTMTKEMWLRNFLPISGTNGSASAAANAAAGESDDEGFMT
jgi:hypothetical protein